MRIQERNVITGILLTIFTCGLYGMYWAFCIGREAVSVKSESDKGILEGILCALVPFVGMYLTEKKFAAGCAAKGIRHKDNAIMYLLIALLPYGWIVDMYMMQTELNDLAEK